MVLSAPGFLGTRADLMTDVVVVGFVAIPPLLWWSALQTRRGAYRLHRAVQSTALAVLTVLLVLFELNIRLRGDSVFFAADAAARPWLRPSLYFHLFWSIGTFVLWAVLVFLSWSRFGADLPGRFSTLHGVLGRLTIAGAIMTAVTGIELYIAAFVL